MLKLQRFFPTELNIDGELIRLRVARLTIAQLEEYEAQCLASSERAQAALRDAAVREAETSAQRAARIATEAEAERTTQDWLREAVSRYVVLEPGQITIAESDGERDVTTVAELFKLYAGRAEIVAGLIAIVRAENRLSPRQKKPYRSLLASEDGLLGRLQQMVAAEEHGAAPAPTADAVSPAATSEPEAATETGISEDEDDPSSGTTDRSSSEAAPSGPSRPM